MIGRGEIWWADLGPAVGSRTAKRRPVLVIQSDRYNASQLATVIVAGITSNTGSARMPGNVFLPSAVTGLRQDSVLNVTQLTTLNKSDVTDYVGRVSGDLLNEVDRGLRRLFQL